MTVDDIYKTVNFLANKHQSKAISPEEFNLALQLVNLEFFKEKYGLPEEYRPGVHLPRQAWQMTQKITDDLSFLLLSASITIDADGMGTLPTNYVHHSSTAFKYVLNAEECGSGQQPGVCLVPIEVIMDDEWNTRLCDSIMEPTLRYPVMRFFGKTIEVAPKKLGTIEMKYLALPQTPERRFTFTNDDDVYDANLSTQLQWPEQTHPDFISRILVYVGINIREYDIVNFAQLRKQQGA